MAGVLILTSGSGPSGSARTAKQLATILADASRLAMPVAHLGPVSDLNVGILLDLPKSGAYPPFEVPLYQHLRSQVRAAAPDVIHAVGPLANRIAPLLTYPGPRSSGRRRTPCPIVASGCDRPGYGLRGWWARKMIHGAARVVARTKAEADRYRGCGVDPEKVVVIPPGVDLPAPRDRDLIRLRSFGLRPSLRLIMVAGGFDAVASMRDAVWAFDVLKYTAPDLHLILAGYGPDWKRCEAFGRAIGGDDYRTRYWGMIQDMCPAEKRRQLHRDEYNPGVRADLPDLFSVADVVWVTHRTGGVQTALEAMAAGRPVVAVNTPDLAEIVADGVTGRLVAVGDPVALAAATADLLARPDRLAEMGEAGRRAAERFSVRAMADRYAAVYDSLITPNA